MSYGHQTPVKVDRVKLIEKLKETVVVREKKRAELFKTDLAKAIKNSEAKIRQEQEYLKRIKMLKSVDEITDHDLSRDYHAWLSYQDYRKDNDLPRLITALELSTEETITIKPDSDIYHYL